MTDDVPIFVASLNTRAATELTIRTLRRTVGPAPPLFVGDGGSTDGSAEMLRRFAQRGWLTVDDFQADSHAEWLDHWVRTCTSKYAIFCDSDMILRRSGWLQEMVDEADRSRSAIVAAEVAPAVEGVIEPQDKKLVDLAERCSPWLLLVDCAALRALGVSFSFVSVQPRDSDGRILVFDTGGLVWAGAAEAGLTRSVMPKYFASRTYTHVGNLSWGRSMGMGSLRYAKKMANVYWQLARLRRDQR